MGASFRDQAAADPIFAADKLLRPRFRSRARWAAPGHRLVPRQPDERRGGAGRPKPECDVRMGRESRPRLKIVIKIGGAALDDAALRRGGAAAIAGIARDHDVAVVHGGGAALTRTLACLGKKSEFVDGLRVTDAETRDVALMVLAGAVNKRLVAELALVGSPA